MPEGNESKDLLELQKTVSRKEMLGAVDEAIISVISGGQSYKIGSRQLQRADLAMLYKMKNDLQAQEMRSNESSLIPGAYVGVFDGR